MERSDDRLSMELCRLGARRHVQHSDTLEMVAQPVELTASEPPRPRFHGSHDRLHGTGLVRADEGEQLAIAERLLGLARDPFWATGEGPHLVEPAFHHHAIDATI